MCSNKSHLKNEKEITVLKGSMLPHSELAAAEKGLRRLRVSMQSSRLLLPQADRVMSWPLIFEFLLLLLVGFFCLILFVFFLIVFESGSYCVALAGQELFM